jgi:hypothetical protein
MSVSRSGEVATFVDVSQFEPGESAFECVAFSAALCKYMGEPQGRPQGSPEDVDRTADYWYGRLTGGIAPSDALGMSLEQLHLMLNGLGLHWRNLPIDGRSAHASDIAQVRTSLSGGRPVLICGSEASFHDLELGDRVPYSWPPAGNHAIVASGVTSDGNLLVRDMANIGPHGLRPGPRRYDAGKMFLISGTEIIPQWSKGAETMAIEASDPVVAGYFSVISAGKWQCRQTGHIIQAGILQFYCSYGRNAFCGLTYLGLPTSNEIPVENLPGVVKQQFERGWLVYDPAHKLDHPPGSGEIYLMHLPA